jgi:hypothetical protein
MAFIPRRTQFLLHKDVTVVLYGPAVLATAAGGKPGLGAEDSRPPAFVNKIALKQRVCCLHLVCGCFVLPWWVEGL